MGIRSPVSNNYAMILGGLKEGVTPLDMAHAYETFADRRHTGSSTASSAHRTQGPTGIAQIQCPQSASTRTIVDKPTYKRIIPATIAQHGPRRC